jgi:ketosteroid isomerase-like protein
MVTVKQLEAFGDGWNRHDVDYLMTFMADDCAFETTAGKEVCGTRYAGREQVREAFARVFKIFPTRTSVTRGISSRAIVGVSEWIFTGTTSDGKKVEVKGCDVFTFKGDKIALKESFFKKPARVRYTQACWPDASVAAIRVYASRRSYSSVAASSASVISNTMPRTRLSLRPLNVTLV